MPTILLAGLFHETHTFLDDTTALADFEVRLDLELEAARGDSSPLGGVFEVAERHGWRLIPAVDFRAQPGGTVEDGVFEAFWEQLEPRLVRALDGGLDAIFLVLHGAMCTARYPDVEGELLGRIRAVDGAAELPLFGVYDLHANFTARMARSADCLVAYRENPHSDARNAAVRAAELLERTFREGTVPSMRFVHPPVVWPPTGTGTADDPMRALVAQARRFEAAAADLWAININAGFSFADTPDTGVSVSLVVGRPGAGAAERDALADAIVASRELGNVVETPVDAVLAGLRPDPRGPTLLVEPSDNIGGGAPGDGTGILRALLRHGVGNAGVILNDPQAVARLAAHAPGERLTLELGGRGSSLDPGPVPLEIELMRRSDGRFTLEDPRSHLASMGGSQVQMGPSAVVQHRGITLLLTSRKTPPFDLGQWRSQGVEPSGYAFIGVKAAVAHRRAYDTIAAASYTVGTPGPCSSDLTSLPFVRIARPIYPLDELPGAPASAEEAR
jgi:microcystin degradation protein MlrC